MTTTLRTVLETHVSNEAIPGAVALVAHADRVELEAVGCLDAAGTAPMARDSIFRIASITKPITAAAAMMLVDDGRVALDDPVGAVAAGAGVAGRRSHAGQPGRRRGPGRPADHRGRPAHLPRRVRLPVRLHAAGGRMLFASCGRDRRSRSSSPHRTSGWPRCPASRCCTSPARLAVQHLLGHPRRADRPGLGPPAAGVPGRAPLRAARHGRHRVRRARRQAGPVHQLLPRRGRRAG